MTVNRLNHSAAFWVRNAVLVLAIVMAQVALTRIGTDVGIAAPGAASAQDEGEHCVLVFLGEASRV